VRGRLLSEEGAELTEGVLGAEDAVRGEVVAGEEVVVTGAVGEAEVGEGAANGIAQIAETPGGGGDEEDAKGGLSIEAGLEEGTALGGAAAFIGANLAGDVSEGFGAGVGFEEEEAAAVVGEAANDGQPVGEEGKGRGKGAGEERNSRRGDAFRLRKLSPAGGKSL